jgi:methylmalonyl-CoA mutase
LTFRIDAGASTAAIAEAFAEVARSADATLVLAYDPVAQFAATAEPGWPRLDRGPNLEEALAAAAAVEGARIIAMADGRIWHAAGASEVQELAAVLATLVAFLRITGGRGGLGVALAADTDLFTTIAKFRALRLLLGRLAEVIGVPADVAIHAETAWRTLTQTEPPMNVLRGTIATLAAIAGGADSVTVLPFGADTEDGQRLARNTQLIAKVEAHLARVADPGAGAGAIEAMTDAFAAQAWASFQAIEAAGGIAAPSALERLTQTVSEMRRRRAQRVASGELPLVGVNVHVAEHANLGGGLVDYPRTLLRCEPLDRAVMTTDGDDR